MEQSEKAEKRCAKPEDSSGNTLPIGRGSDLWGIYFIRRHHMNKNSMKKWLSLFLCLALIAAMALSMTGCKEDSKEPTETPATNDGTFEDGAVLGEGATSFAFTVVGVDGKETKATVKTDKATVGEALLELGVISGETFDFGVMVTTVNGVTLDYETDGKYLAFYIGDEYAMEGADATEIDPSVTYSFRAE